MLQQDFVSKINKIAKDAGQGIMAIYQQSYDVYTKDDHSPLTAADLYSHKLISEKLAQLTPDIPILSEEAADISWDERKTWDTYWLIDPLDGTKEFIKRNGEFTVNIALIHQGVAVLGVVYAPVLEALYYSSTEIGAWKQQANEQAEQIRTQGQIKSGSELRVVGSRSHQSDLLIDYLKKFENYQLVSMGSSLKLCLVAEGKADIYPRLGLTSEWDTAAAQAIVEAAGGCVINYETNKQLKYNTKDSLLNPFFIVKGYS